MTCARRSEIVGGLVRKNMGEAEGAMKIGDLYTREWILVSRFFERDFCLFQDATSMAAAGFSAGRPLAGDPANRDDGLNVLRAGGSDDPSQILQKPGLDLTGPKPCRAVLTRMERDVAEMEKLVAER